MRKWKRRQRAKMQPLSREVNGEIDEHERPVASEAKNGRLRNDHILAFGVVFETLLTSWNSFSVCFAILLMICCTWPTVPKALAMPTNSNAHMLPVGSKVIEMRVRHAL